MGIKNAFAAIVTSLCIATTLAGCGGGTAEDDARPPASPSGEAATGPEITAKTYSYQRQMAGPTRRSGHRASTSTASPRRRTPVRTHFRTT